MRELGVVVEADEFESRSMLVHASWPQQLGI